MSQVFPAPILPDRVLSVDVGKPGGDFTSVMIGMKTQEGHLVILDHYEADALDPPELKDRCESGAFQGIASLRLCNERYIARCLKRRRNQDRYYRMMRRRGDG